MVRIVADENMRRLFGPNWREILFRLRHEYRYQIEELPVYMRGASDNHIVDFIISNGYDGIITEDTDFFETHRSNLLWRLINSNKIVLVVRRVNPTMRRGEVRIYRYAKDFTGKARKEEITRLVIDY